MDKELVERITRLVLERLVNTEDQYTVSLDDNELEDWNSLHLGNPSEAKSHNGYLKPLSDAEVEDWARCTHSYSYSVHSKYKENGNKARFIKYS
ncbi:hypothetical protein [Bacillus sp. V5-8f]|uniref:hypothetical protein n=1 Tax=Bacillus sp. V5-8f TaxID=2053044 RepID=UPI000C789420|nr:hypothetical protein [Bacillus sp. V5-8f]PLT32702.1 hypothetical protein CUU64_17465 [Bacillus sp. V5-8f]